MTTILSIGLWCSRHSMLCDPEEQVDVCETLHIDPMIDYSQDIVLH